MPAISRARPAFELGLDACVFILLPLLTLAPRGTAALGGVAGLCALGIAIPGGGEAWRRVRGLALFLALLLLWGLASVLWSCDRVHSLLIAVHLAGLFAVGLALIAAAAEIRAPARLMHCLIAGYALALVLVTVQLRTGGALTAHFADRPFEPYALNDIEDGFVLLLPPLLATLWLRRQRIGAALLVAVTAAMLAFVLVGQTARVAFLLGAMVAVPLFFWRRPLTRAAAALSAVLIFVTPLILPRLAGIGVVMEAAHDYYKTSLWHRLEIWSFVGKRIADKPLIGWGLDSSRAIPGGGDQIPGGVHGQVWLSLHPHNAALQAWVELGAPGALLFALLAVWVWLALGKADWPRLYAAACGATLTSVLLVGYGSYGMWQEWWITTQFLTLFLILVMARLAASPPETRL